MQREKESEGKREGERVDQLRLPFCLLLIFVSSRSRFVFLCFLTVCYFLTCLLLDFSRLAGTRFRCCFVARVPTDAVYLLWISTAKVAN